jgi:superfamily II DNA or RNA helicase
MIKLRPYQEKLISDTRASLKSGNRSPLLVSPCGSGKTVCFAFFASEVTKRGKRTLILAHRSELLDQISDILRQFDVKHSFIAPGRSYHPAHHVQVASVFSVVRRLNRLVNPDIIITDEAHHCVLGSTWSKVFSAFPKAWRIGVTATPQRLSGESLRDVFDDLILGPSVQDLISLGSLCKYKIYAPKTIDTSGLHMRAGDFAKNELNAAADKPSITGDAIKEYRKLADKKRAIVFCCSIEHAKHVAQQFKDSGYRALSIDGKMDRYIRKQIVTDYKGGKIDVLTSVDVISEGFDLPAIEVAIMLRPTASLALWIQQSGRALRPYEGKDYAYILDHAGNCQRHGFPDDEREWSLDGQVKKNKDEESKIHVRTCPKCFACCRSQAPICPYCQYVFEVQPREVLKKEGELEEINLEIERKKRKREQGKAETLQDLIELGKERGYVNAYAWAKHVFNARQAKRLQQGRVS